MSLSKKIIIILTITAMAVVMGAASAGCLPMAAGENGEPEELEGAQGFLAQYGTWIWLVVLVAAFYFLLIRPQRQKSKKAQDLLSSIQRGDEVITIGGFYGRVKDIREDTLIVTLSSGVDVKISKSAVSKKVGPA